MKGNIKEIMNSKHDQDINYSKILNKIDERKDKSYLKYLKPIGGLASCLLVVLLVANVVGLPGMGSSAKYESAYDYAMPEEAVAAYDNGMYYETSGNSYSNNIEVRDAKIIYTANISFETKDYNASNEALNNLVNKYNGYILSSDTWSNEYEGVTYHNGNCTVRIPVDNYSAFMNETNGVGNVQNVSQNQDDITDDYIDVQTRIETYKVQEQRLIELLAKAENLSDIISIEDKLSEVRYNIESYQSRMNYYTKVTDYATITIYISEVINYSNNNKIIKALNNTIDNFVDFLEDIAVFFIYALPFILALVVIVIVVVMIIKKRNRNKK